MTDEQIKLRDKILSELGATENADVPLPPNLQRGLLPAEEEQRISDLYVTNVMNKGHMGWDAHEREAVRAGVIRALKDLDR